MFGGPSQVSELMDGSNQEILQINDYRSFAGLNGKVKPKLRSYVRTIYGCCRVVGSQRVNHEEGVMLR